MSQIYNNLVTLLLFSILLSMPSLSGANTVEQAPAYEKEVIAIIAATKSADFDRALELADQHLETYPKSKIIRLLKGDILRAMVDLPVSTKELADDDDLSEEGKLRKQIEKRWQHYQNINLIQNQVPANLIDIGEHQYVMVADMKSSRLYLYENQDGQPKLKKDYYLTVGSKGYGKEAEGDNKTPIGVYSYLRHIPDAELPDLYGGGAYPVDYPNRFDRSLKRTGYGIWLHGTPSDTYARAPWASEGCFVLSNDDLKDVERFIDLDKKTPIILAESVEWLNEEQRSGQQKSILKVIESWKKDWESLDTSSYLSHYSRNSFNFGNGDYDKWASRKLQVNDLKTFIQLDLDIEDVFLYPGEQDMFVVRFTQRYLSNNYAGETSKKQYWKKDETGKWKIIYEG